MIDFLQIKEFQSKIKSKEDEFRNEVIHDLWICLISREASIMGRKEVLTGKAKFGILGDGKEVPQVAMARAFRKGDFRSGYYRDQTFMFALGLSSLEDYFSQLYADSDNDPFSGGRQMNCHFATSLIDENGEWLSHKDQYNISSDISSTGGQMARSLGIALASKKYRDLKELIGENKFSQNGNEVCFCTIGDASTSEGIFWETMNAAAVMKVPLAVSVWDDGYGISVPIELQTIKGSISKALAGFAADEEDVGIQIYTAKAWDYPTLCDLYEKAIYKVRQEQMPALIHIKDATQPQGHSTSGSHERYKSKERLEWEIEKDCIENMAQWMIDAKLIDEKQLESLRDKAKQYAKECKDRAWKAYVDPINDKINELKAIYKQIEADFKYQEVIDLEKELNEVLNPSYAELVQNARKLHQILRSEETKVFNDLDTFIQEGFSTAHKRYHTELYSDSPKAAINIPVIEPEYDEDTPLLNGFQILNTYFDNLLEKDPYVVAFGEDVGNIGDVNQGFAGLQIKYGSDRVFDTGIREWSIMGQAIGLAMRGIRPIAEIQYLDYLVYGLTPLTDDLATLRYRSNGIQTAPAIIRTRGHRLEGIWHAGSPLGMLINSLRGMYIMVPRNMTQAVGFYNTMVQSDDPGLIIECLNGYRLKEKLPSNIGEYTVPLGVPEVLKEGEDITLVTYGSCIRVAQEGIKQLEIAGIDVELIDVQTLLPFDLEGVIVESLKKTNRIVFMDEDVPGGATAYMMQIVLEEQGGYFHLDSKPVCLTANAHRTPYGSDGDYFTKPNPEDVYDSIYNIMSELG
jgi:pyruvate/2-oxoglutarate/acetoin dehydrogenase E1 component/TPP-dependent pyruvate/acetoin dehydrogenase alpha subunit